MSAGEPHDFIERYMTLARFLRAVVAEKYAEIGLGSAQAKILRHIGKNSRISQADLARATDTAPTLTGRAIEPLVARGWVRRKRSEVDRREYVLELTAAGQRTRQQIEERRTELFDRIAGALDDRDIADFSRIAKKIYAELGAEEPPRRT